MNIIAAVWKELLEISHDRTMLAVLLVFPVFIMLFMGSSFQSMEINGLPVGVVGPEESEFSVALLSGLNESQAFKLHQYQMEADAMTDFRNGQLKAVIIIPEDFEWTLRKGNGSQIRIIVDNSDLALEQSVIAAMSSVVQASSADITKGYVSAAWEELGELNDSASKLAEDISQSREKMNQTRESLISVKEEMNELNITRLDDSLDDASSTVTELQKKLVEERDKMLNASEDRTSLLNETEHFLVNASFALNESMTTVSETYSTLESQIEELNQSAITIGMSISGLEALKSTITDPIAISAIDLNIVSLQALHNNTLSQIDDAGQELERLEELNTTLEEFGSALNNYSGQLDNAKTWDDSSGLEALNEATESLISLDASFIEAGEDVAQLGAVIEGMRTTIDDIEATLDQALAQTESVDKLIASLQGIVEEQTAKDPERIASPLSVVVENQYTRTSFVDFIIPQVIAISLLFSCFLLASISLVREKTKNTIIRALLTPGGLLGLVISKIATMVLLSLAQVILILLVALALFGVRPPLDNLMLVWGTMISALVLSSIGILIGFYARTESAAIQTCLLIAIPMLFLGNIIFSPDLLPAYTRVLQELLPLAHITSIFKVVLITGGDPTVDVMALFTYFVLLVVVLGLIVYKRKDISHYM